MISSLLILDTAYRHSDLTQNLNPVFERTKNLGVVFQIKFTKDYLGTE